MAGLKDMNQLITYQYEAGSMNRQWYSVLQKYNFGEIQKMCRQDDGTFSIYI